MDYGMEAGKDTRDGGREVMRLAVISFTRKGSRCCARLVKQFRDRGDECLGYIQERFLDEYHEEAGLIPVRESLADWTQTRFLQVDGLIFIGAAGIAVRAIAPLLKDKKTDPAVVVADELGTWAISLLSGHVGGANRLAGLVAEILGGQAVITTATDLEEKTAVDLLAGAAGLVIADWELARRVSADLLEEKAVGFFSDFSWPEKVPDGFTRKERCLRHVWITGKVNPGRMDLISLFADADSQILRLVPKIYCVGIGCRKGVSGELIYEQLTEVMQEYNLAVEGIRSLASIDLKKEEAGILAVADRLGLSLTTYTAAELLQLKGDFSSSSFVARTTGVDNVCERAALLASGPEGILAVQKQARNGVTIAVAVLPWKKESI